MKKLRALLESAKSLLVGMGLISGKELKLKRLTICAKCEHLDMHLSCQKCKCNVSRKACLKASKCPIGKW